MTRTDLSASEARRIALAAQGFDRPRPRGRVDDLIFRRHEFTEHWVHEASIVPMSAWPLLHYRRQSHRVRPHSFDRFLLRDPPTLVASCARSACAVHSPRRRCRLLRGAIGGCLPPGWPRCHARYARPTSDVAHWQSPTGNGTSLGSMT